MLVSIFVLPHHMLKKRQLVPLYVLTWGDFILNSTSSGLSRYFFVLLFATVAGC